jgi:hypothetical protein
MSERKREILHAYAPKPDASNLTMCALTWEDVLADAGICLTKISAWTDCRECQQALGIEVEP